MSTPRCHRRKSNNHTLGWKVTENARLTSEIVLIRFDGAWLLLSLEARNRLVACDLGQHDNVIVLSDPSRADIFCPKTNLVMNGIEATASKADGPRELLLESQNQGPDLVVVSVCDSGAGIDPGKAEHLFEPFYTTKPGGMGMGLSISRSIIEAHGGRLWAAANQGTGATFQFSLPAGSTS